MLFAASVALATVLQGSYSSRTEYISGLSALTADSPWAMVGGFVVLGLLALPFAAGLHRGLPPGSALAPGLIAGAGVGLAAIGLLRNDCSDALQVCKDQLEEHASWHSIAHDVVSAPAFLCIVLAPLAMARRVRRDDTWGDLAQPSVLVVPPTAMLMVVYGLELAGDWGGVVQRGFVALPLAWVLGVSWRLWQVAGIQDPGPGAAAKS